MAKSALDAIRNREAAQAKRHVVTERSRAGSRVRGFTRHYSPQDIARIEAERAATRERLLREE